jgi:hypothetical protein
VEKSVQSRQTARSEWTSKAFLEETENARKPELAPLVKAVPVAEGYLGKVDYQTLVGELSMADINRFQFHKNHDREAGLDTIPAGGGIDPAIEP